MAMTLLAARRANEATPVLHERHCSYIEYSIPLSFWLPFDARAYYLVARRLRAKVYSLMYYANGVSFVNEIRFDLLLPAARRLKRPQQAQNISAYLLSACRDATSTPLPYFIWEWTSRDDDAAFPRAIAIPQLPLLSIRRFPEIKQSLMLISILMHFDVLTGLIDLSNMRCRDASIRPPGRLLRAHTLAQRPEVLAGQLRRVAR